MGYINLPPSLQALFADIKSRLQKLENSTRFTMPTTAPVPTQPTITGSATGDPSNLRVGDIWLNTTSNTPKYVNASGAVTAFGGGGGSSVVETPRVKTGYYYSYLGTDQSGTTNAAQVVNTLTLQPFYLGSSATATRLAVNITTAFAGGVARLGIYNNSANEDYPGTLLLDAGTISLATTGAKQITISQSLSQGLYWLAILPTTGQITAQAMSEISGTILAGGATANTTMIPAFTTASFQGLTNGLGWKQTGQTSFPATFTGTTIQTTSIISMWVGF